MSAGKPLRLASLALTGPAQPPALLAAAAGSSLAWASRDGELFWQGSEPSESRALGRLGGGPLKAIALARRGDQLAWLGREGAGCLVPGGGEIRRLAGTAEAAAIAFAGGFLLAAPGGAGGELHLLGARAAAASRLPLGQLSLEGLTSALRDQGLENQAEVVALWVAMHAGWREAEELIAPRLLQLRRRVLGASYLEKGNSGRGALLVALRGGGLVRVFRRDGAWQKQELTAPQRQRFIEGHQACQHPDGLQVAAALEGGGIGLWDGEGQVVTTWHPRPPAYPFALRADGCLLAVNGEGGLDIWRLPAVAAEATGEGAALACAGAHLASFALRCVEPHDAPFGASVGLLARLWRVGQYPPLVWVHDLLALLEGGQVSQPPGLDPESAPEAWQKALERLASSQALRRLRAIKPGRPALETAIARLLGRGESPAALELFRPLAGEEAKVEEALLRCAGQGGSFDRELLQPPIEAWEKILIGLDLEELRTLDQVGSAAFGLPGCLADGLSLKILPESVRAVLGALMRILPREVMPAKRRGQAAALKGFGGYGEIARKGHIDQLLPTEYAFRSLLATRVVQGDALYYGRESNPPERHESTWLVLDGSASMLGDPLLLARAIGVAAARLARRRVEFRFFDHQLGPAQKLERPSDIWQLIHGKPQVPPPPEGAILQKTAAVWQKLLRRLRARGEGEGRVHIVLISHEFLGAEESEVIVPALSEIAGEADLRLVMIQFPDMRPYFESMKGKKGFEAWMWRGPSLAPARPPWKILQEKGVPVALIPVGRLWEAGD